jgi:hypothetical protein
VGLKGTVSPDIGFYLKVYKIELLLFVGPLMVFTFFYFVDHEIFIIIFQNCFYENTF